MTRVACLMMQKQEDLLLRPWLAYHGYLFGFENLHVFHDASSSDGIRRVLRDFAAIGVNVDAEHGEPDGFARQDAIFADCVRRLKEADLCDVVVSLASDEFLIVEGQDGIGCHRTDILREFARIERDGVSCRITSGFANRPGYVDLYRFEDCDRPVTVLRAPDDADAGSAEERRPSSLICVGMRSRPFDRTLTSETARLAAATDVAAVTALDRIADAASVHLSSLLTTPDASGVSEPAEAGLLIRFAGLAHYLKAFMPFHEISSQWEVGQPLGLLADAIEIDLDRFPFRAAGYREANADLSEKERLFRHFVTWGFFEGRGMDVTDLGRQEAANRMLAIAAWKRDGVSGYSGLVNAFLRAGRQAETDAILLAAIAQYGENDTLLYEYAMSALHGGDFVASSERMDRYRARRPDDPSGYALGSLARRLAGNLDRAEELVAAGLARFPDEFLLLDAEAQIAGARGDWARAVAIFQDLCVRFPGQRWLCEAKLAEAGFQLRNQAIDAGAVADIDIMDGPVAVAMSEAETARVLDLCGFTSLAQLRAFFMGFESLGQGCEFGMVQRRFGAEPISLLRWNSIDTGYLSAALEARFDGLDAPDNLFVRMAGAEYLLCDNRYQTRMHTFVYKDAVAPDVFIAQQTKRTTYLKRKLIGDLQDGHKIFVYLTPSPLTADEMARLHAAIRSYGPGRLLTVTATDRPSRVGRVEERADGHLVGTIARLGGGTGGWNIDFDGWLSVCRAAAAHWQTEATPAERVA